MNMNRRSLLGGIAAAALLQRAVRAAEPAHPFRAVLFDGLVLFDLRPVFGAARELFAADVGQRLVDVWRAKQFEYQWLRALSGSYVDFARASEDALLFAARQTHVDLPEEKRRDIMRGFASVKAWPDVAEGLAALRRSVPRLGILSNMTPAMLKNGLQRSGIAQQFDYVLSTDAQRTYKPDRRAYALGTNALHLRASEVLFVAFAGWDVAGAKHFGYPTFWLNRLGAEAEQLDEVADGTGKEWEELLRFVEQRAAR